MLYYWLCCSYVQYLKSAEVYTPNHRADCKFGTELSDFPFPVMGAVGGQVKVSDCFHPKRQNSIKKSSS